MEKMKKIRLNKKPVLFKRVITYTTTNFIQTHFKKSDLI
jgi:hypothetical protein